MSWRNRMHPSGLKTPARPSREWWLSRKHYVCRKTLSSKPRGSLLLAAVSSQGTPVPPVQPWGAPTELGGLSSGCRAQQLPWLGLGAAAAVTAGLLWLQLPSPILSWLWWCCCGAVRVVRLQLTACGSVTHCGEPKISPLWKSAHSCTVVLLFGHRQKKCFSFGWCGLNYCCVLPLSREDWKFVVLGLALIKDFFLLWGINI